jgi:NAD(P)H-dependent FMN reductase
MLLVSGSTRAASTNTAALRTAQALAPPTVDAVLYDGLSTLPHFNPDDDVAPLPPAAAELRAQIGAADAVLFSTPEYAGALPGSFKNLLDWTIGDDQVRSISEKPVAWLNTSAHGGEDAHASLRIVLTYAHATIVEAACARVPVNSAMVVDGLVVDVEARAIIAGAVTSLATFLESVTR